MKKLFGVMLAVFISSSAFSQGIEFEQGTFAKALAKAKKENKMVFMDCYTKWCGPCKKMAKTTFTQQEVGNYFNANFINIKVDMESEIGKPLKEKYHVASFPTLLWLDSDGNIQHRTAGAVNEKLLIKLAKQALDTENNFAALDKRYKNGDRDPELIARYVLAIADAGIDAKEVTDSYFSSKKPEEFINKKDFKLITSIVRKSSHPMFHFVVENEKRFSDIVGVTHVDKYLVGTMYGELKTLEYNGDQDAFEAKKEELKKLGNAGVKTIDYLNLSKLQKNSDKSKYYQGIIDFSMKYDYNNPANLNDGSSLILRSKECIAKEILEQALDLSKRAVELDPKYSHIDTYAHLLYRLGRVEEAKVQALKIKDLLNDSKLPEQVREFYVKTLWSLKFLNEEK